MSFLPRCPSLAKHLVKNDKQEISSGVKETNNQKVYYTNQDKQFFSQLNNLPLLGYVAKAYTIAAT